MFSPSPSKSPQTRNTSSLVSRFDKTHGAYNRSLNCKRCAIVVGSILIQLTTGTVNGFGNLLPYIASYLAQFTYDHSNTDASLESFYAEYLGSCNWILCAAYIAMAIGCMFGAAFESMWGVRFTMFIGCVMVTFGMGAMYWAVSHLCTAVFFSGVVFGFGCGITNSVSIAVAMRWFPHSQSRITGAILLAFGAAPFLFNIGQTLHMNPYNLPISPAMGYLHSPSVVDSVPSMYVATAIIFAAMQIVGLIALDNPPNYESEMDRDYYRPMEVCRSGKFWILLLCALMNLIPFLFFIQSFKLFSVEYINVTNDHFLSILGAIAAVFGGIGRLIWGIVCDWAQNKEYHSALNDWRVEKPTVGFSFTMGVMGVMQTVLLCSLPFIRNMAIVTNSGINVGPESLLCLWMCLIFFCNSGFYSIFPRLLAKMFGDKYATALIGFVMLCEIPATVIDSFVGIYRHSSFVGGWFHIMLCMGVCTGISTSIAVFFTSDSVDITMPQDLRKKSAIMSPHSGITEDPSYPQTNYHSTVMMNRVG